MYYTQQRDTTLSPLPYLLHEVHTTYIVRCTYAHISKPKSKINIRRQSAKKAKRQLLPPLHGYVACKYPYQKPSTAIRLTGPESNLVQIKIQIQPGGTGEAKMQVAGCMRGKREQTET